MLHLTLLLALLIGCGISPQLRDHTPVQQAYIDSICSLVDDTGWASNTWKEAPETRCQKHGGRLLDNNTYPCVFGGVSGFCQVHEDQIYVYDGGFNYLIILPMVDEVYFGPHLTIIKPNNAPNDPTEDTVDLD